MDIQNFWNFVSITFPFFTALYQLLFLMNVEECRSNYVVKSDKNKSYLQYISTSSMLNISNYIEYALSNLQIYKSSDDTWMDRTKSSATDYDTEPD